MRSLVLLLIISFSTNLMSADYELVFKNKKGNAFVKQWFEQFEEEMKKVSRGEIKQEEFKKPDTLPIVKAYAQYIQALSMDSFNPLLHINLAVSLELLEKYDDAMKEYNIALKYSSPQSQERLYTLINIARVNAKLKKIDLALNFYQQALDLNTEILKVKDVTKQIKTNIELLFKGGKGKDKGDSEDKKPGKDGDEKSKGNPKNGQAKKFKSKNLSKEDVRRILNELKDQEQKIRQKINRKKIKEQPRDKQW